MSCFTSNAFAVSVCEESTETNVSNNGTVDYSEVAKQLSYAEVIKDNYGMSDVDFGSIVASDTVYAYEYTASGTEKIFDFVPLMYEGELIAWVMVSMVDDNLLYQFTTSFVDEAKELIADGKEIAIIYAYDSCYLYDGSILYLLNVISEDDSVESRKVIYTVDELSACNIVLSAPNAFYELPEISSVDGVVVPTESYVLSVDHVYQGDGTYMCWAASIACVLNYLLGTSYTTVEVAIKCKGSSDSSYYNTPANINSIGYYLIQYLSSYGINYFGDKVVPSISLITYNLSLGYPIVGGFFASDDDNNGYPHASVIYGIGITAGVVDYVYVMDPSEENRVNSFRIATYDSSMGTLYFTSASTGKIFYLRHAACASWSY